MNSTAYSSNDIPIPGTTQTGLDQLVDVIGSDLGLAGANQGSQIREGQSAADALNHLILDAIQATGAGVNGIFTSNDVIAINGWIRQNHLLEFMALHGNDNGSQETGFHLVQNNGAIRQYQGVNLIDTVLEGIYQIGFAIQDGVFLNEAGNTNTSVAQVANWLTQFFTDHANTNTGLDRATELILADQGLAKKIPWTEIAAGADAANGINQLFKQAIAQFHLADDGSISAADILQINQWIRSDATRYAQFLELHGDDDGKNETGFHQVQGDGGNTVYFRKNLVNTVLDGIYHIGFEVQDGRFRNEDGNANATVQDVADWVTYFYVDQSTTGTGLDRIVDAIKTDTSLASHTSASDINQGAAAANALNHLIVEAIQATGVASHDWITTDDIRTINSWIRSNRFDTFVALHGDDEDGVETGFHLVQNDGAFTKIFGSRNLINGVADSIYHIGFEIIDSKFVNEDGDRNATVSDVSSWFNYFYGGKTVIYGSNEVDNLQGTDQAEQIVSHLRNDTINAGGGNDLIDAGWGADVINAGAGDDIIYAGNDNDTIDGGEGSDRYIVRGNIAANNLTFEGWDTYHDTGNNGIDRIEAIGPGAVDIGFLNFNAASGIEIIDATGAAGTVRLLGNEQANILDFSSVQLVGNTIKIDGGYGNDQIIGNRANNILIGGGGNDTVNGGDGSDDYLVTGTEADGWSGFQGYDTYADTGVNGSDRIVAQGNGNVDIGLLNFSAANGIEVIDGTQATGTVRLLGNWEANILDFSSVQFVGNNIKIDGGYGNDQILGNSANNILIGGGGNDTLNGGGGSDDYIVRGNYASGIYSFQGYDTYADTGVYGSDRIVAQGDGNVDIGLSNFDAVSGIEVIDGTGAAGAVRLLGNGASTVWDFSTVQFIGSNFQIDAGSGNDTITGSNANDVIVGADGDDKIIGGLGADQLTGGLGKDSFIFRSIAEIGWGSSKDTLKDFTSGQDLINLAAIDANTLLAGDQAFSYISTGSFTGSAGELRFSGGILSGDVNGDSSSDFELAITGISSLTGANFSL